MLARLFPLLLLLLTRDGLLHRFDGQHDSTTAAPRPVALAVVDGKLALVAGGRLTLDGKRVPGDFSDVRALAGGHQLWARAGERALRIDLASGKRTVVLERPRLHRLAADGDELFAETDGEIETITADRKSETITADRKSETVSADRKSETITPDRKSVAITPDRKWKVAGRPIALAAGDGKLWAATKEGPLVQIDRRTGAQTPLGLGDWWGTLALAFADGKLYAVTLSGKLWQIDPIKREKTIVAMDGWQGAIDLAVLR